MIDDFEDQSIDAGSPWLATFADLMSLLLTFFVLLLSFATLDIVKFRDALGSIKEAFGVTVNVDTTGAEAPTSPISIMDAAATSPASMDDQGLLEELSSAITAERLEHDVSAATDARGVVLRVSGEVLYRQGEADLRPEAGPILSRVAALIGRTAHRVMIEGHTDDIPIRTAQFPSNWELSTARAIAAMRFLVAQGVDATRVGVAGYADFRPLQPNETETSRAANRRVEFVFIRASGT